MNGPSFISFGRVVVMVLALCASHTSSAQVIRSVLTQYSATGVPTKISIFGSSLCTTSACTTKPTVTLGGTALTGVAGTSTNVTANLGVIPDGDYVLALRAGSTTVNYNLTIKANTASGSGSATVAVGTTTTGAPNTNASVTNSGTATAAVLNFTIPRGATGAQGPTGPAGVQGPMGLQGPPGIQGPPGTNGQDGVPGPKGDKGDQGEGFKFVGAWTSVTPYNPRDIVTAGGSSYLAVSASSDVNPLIDTSGTWALLAAKGDAGASGEVGVAGQPGPMGPPGPAGADGPPGPIGAAGPTGLQGAKGEPGETGPAGPMGPPGPSFGEWMMETTYAMGQLAYTRTDPFGNRNFCVYYALVENINQDPRSNSAVATDAVWGAFDDPCRTGAAPPPPSAGFTIGGNLIGLAPSTDVLLALTVDGGITTARLNSNGTFILPRRVAIGSTFLLSVAAQPAGGTCAIANPSGTVTSSVSNIIISCGVLSAELQRLEIYNNSSTLPIGYPRQFAVNGVAANGVKTDVTLAASWASSDAAIATVNPTNGKVIGITAGTAVISASFGGISTSVGIEILGGPVVTTVAGGIAGDADGIGRQAKFAGPRGMAIDANGVIFIADGGNNKIRRFDPLTNTVTTVAGTGITGGLDGPASTAQFNVPHALTFDPNGSLYVAEEHGHRIRKITFSGPEPIVSTLAGDGQTGYSDSAAGAVDGTGVRFNRPLGIASDSSGNIYVADTGNTTIRKILPSGVTTTFAGSQIPGYRDGIGSEAEFNYPASLAIDSQGNLYVSDPSRLRKITPTGVVTTVLQYFEAGAMHVATSGVLYIGRGQNVSYVNINDSVPTSNYLAGRSCCFADGPANEADFSNVIIGIVSDGAGSVYAADLGNSAIRKIYPVP